MDTNGHRADPDDAEDRDLAHWKLNPWAPGLLPGSLHRVPRRLADHELGTAIRAACDGDELRVQLSNGHVYSVSLTASAARWGVDEHDLRSVTISDDGTVITWPRLGSELSVATLIGTTEVRLAQLAAQADPVGSSDADPDANGFAVRGWRLNPNIPGMREGHLHRVDRHLDRSRLGVAVVAGCDGHELQVVLSNGDLYRVPVAAAARRWGVSRGQLRGLEIRSKGLRLYWPRLRAEMSVATIIGTSEERLAAFARRSAVAGSSRPEEARSRDS